MGCSLAGLEDLRQIVGKLLKRAGTYEEIVREFIRDLQRALLSADVNVRLVFDLTNRIRERALKEKPPPAISRKEWLVKITYEELTKFFGGEKRIDIKPPYTPYIIMLVGVQGSGKTTTVGKLALFYKTMGYRVGVICADTYRPGAYEQLYQIAKSVGVLFYGDNSSKDVIDIVSKGIKHFREKGVDIVIIDTAGRHGYGREEALLAEMREISEKINPDEVTLVIDASMGQKSYDLAAKFHKATPIGSIIVTKMDGTAKGGGALSAVAATGARIKFIGTGEKLDELEPFNPKRFVSRILGMGDIESLLERIEKLSSIEEFEKTMTEMVTGRITYRTIYRQIIHVQKLGPFKKILQMLPGISTVVSSFDDIARIGEKKLRRWLNIMNSMTYEELDKPELVEEKSRIKRISYGSGAEVGEVKELIAYYKNLKRLMKQFKKRKDIVEKLLGSRGLHP